MARIMIYSNKTGIPARVLADGRLHSLQLFLAHYAHTLSKESGTRIEWHTTNVNGELKPSADVFTVYLYNEKTETYQIEY